MAATRTLGWPILLGVAISCGWCQPGAAQPSVALEVVTEPGFPIDGHQRWMEFLSASGFSSLRMRGARGDDEPRVENRGTAADPRYNVTAILTGGNVLQLPGAAIRLGQRPQLAAWLQRLQQGGEEALSAQPGPFGLLGRQWSTVREELARKVTWETQDRRVQDVVEQFASQLRIPIDVDPSAQSLLSSRAAVADSWTGLSCGTALAGIVRPLGLVVVPATGGGQPVVRLRIARSENVRESWPIGSAPQEPPDKLAPDLFRFVPVEIHDRPLLESLAAIEQRVNIPFYFDHLQLGQQQFDRQLNVTYGPKKTYYKKIVDELLFQGRLRSELRVDEAGKPFLWITTIKR